MSLILCLSPAYQPFVRCCRERRVCPFFHIFCVTQSHLPAYKPALTILCRKGDFHYNEMTKDIDFSLNPMLFVSLPGELDQLRSFMHRYMTCVSLILCLSPAYQPFVRSCRERRVCPSFCVSRRRTSPLCGVVGRDVCVPFFTFFCVTQSHLRINQPLLFYVGRVIFITMR